MKVKNLVRLIILFFLSAQHINFCSQQYNIPPYVHLKLYQMMKDIHEVLQINKIPYWIHAGTLLGAVRHQGIIPWDDDLDIIIEKKDQESFEKLYPIFKSLGYIVQPLIFGCKIILRQANLHDIWMDVMIFSKHSGKYYYDFIKKSPPSSPVITWDKIFFAEEDLFPLKEYKFGEIYVMGPYNPIPFLNLTYPKWNEYAIPYNHNFNGRLFETAGKSLTAAQPTGPLEDRVYKTRQYITKDHISKTLTIELATEYDTDSVVELLNQLGFSQESPAMCLHKIKLFCSHPLDKVWVAKINQKVVGVLALNIINPFYYPQCFARIDTIVVDQQYRKCGIGKALMNVAEKYAQEKGCCRVFLTSGNHRTAAHDFYKHIGYVSNAMYLVKNLS